MLDLQADVLDGLKTRIVAPLVPVEAVDRLIDRLNPRFAIAGKTYLLATHLLTAIDQSEMGSAVFSLAGERDRIIAAADFAFQGF